MEADAEAIQPYSMPMDAEEDAEEATYDPPMEADGKAIQPYSMAMDAEEARTREDAEEARRKEEAAACGAAAAEARRRDRPMDEMAAYRTWEETTKDPEATARLKRLDHERFDIYQMTSTELESVEEDRSEVSGYRRKWSSWHAEPGWSYDDTSKYKFDSKLYSAFPVF
jgi:hypothetical protein